jgi:glyoxylase-like metal-dependent hydrolase (beta-lactamase superfamily II)
MKSAVFASTLALAVTLVSASVWTGATTPNAPGPQLAKSQAGFYRVKVGSVEVVALSDGTVPLDTKVLHAPHHHVDKLLKFSYVHSPLDASVNAFLIVRPDRLLMVDAGTAELYGPTLDKLSDSIRAAGYAPEKITDILITHIHTDHTGGLMRGDQRVFPNATVHISKTELDFWMDPLNKERAPAHQKQYFDQAWAKVTPYIESGQVKTFVDGVDPVPGIRSIPSPGHTPGHTFYSFEDGGERIVFWGDILHVPEVQFADPAVTIDFDVDARMAERQRKKAFAEAARKGYIVAPAHMAFPAIGRLRKDSTGYRWIPVPFVNDAYGVK